VLAIGIVVDDAIVVVEAVEHHIEEECRRAGHLQGMEEGPPGDRGGCVAERVFVPCAFISGIKGRSSASSH